MPGYVHSEAAIVALAAVVANAAVAGSAWCAKLIALSQTSLRLFTALLARSQLFGLLQVGVLAATCTRESAACKCAPSPVPSRGRVSLAPEFCWPVNSMALPCVFNTLVRPGRGAHLRCVGARQRCGPGAGNAGPAFRAGGAGRVWPARCTCLGYGQHSGWCALSCEEPHRCTEHTRLLNMPGTAQQSNDPGSVGIAV